MRIPNFFIVGAPKCGTSALSDYLKGHPSIFMTDPKEPNFFNREFDYYWGRDPDSIEEYLRLYENARDEHVALGEASVWYLYSTDAAWRIAEFNPASRIIVMIRNPIDLVHSLHAQLVYTLDEDVEDFERAWNLQAERRRGISIPKKCRQPAFLQYGAVGSLTEQIERFLDRFPRDAVEIFVFDDFATDTASVYRRALELLKLPDDGRTVFEAVNRNKVHRFPAVATFLHRPPRMFLTAADVVKRTLGVDRLGLLERVRGLNRRVERRSPLSPTFRSVLIEFFADEIRKLERLLDRSFEHWLVAREEPSRSPIPPRPSSPP